ncbi:hypothetical protein ABNF65_02735 [Paenibacillus larvae]
MIKKVATEECVVLVEPEVLQPYFYQASAEDYYNACESIRESIKRHVDGISYINILRKHEYEVDGDTFETLYDALEHLFAEDYQAPIYQIHYEQPSDNGVGTRVTRYSFEKVIEEAWKNPYKFEIKLKESTPLTEEQAGFLNRVINASLAQKGEII